MIDNKLYEYMAELLKRTPLDFIRYKYDEINWNGRLVGIVGPRGVGKSTMILQRIKLSKEGHHLYVSADNIYFSNHSLVDFADEFIKEGGTHLYIDEIHKYAGWSRELKQIYDMHPSLNLYNPQNEMFSHFGMKRYNFKNETQLFKVIPHTSKIQKNRPASPERNTFEGS